MTEETGFLELEEVETNAFDSLYEKLEEYQDSDKDPEISPETRIDARDWLLARLHLEDEIDFYKKEYIPALKEKYLGPIEKKISQHERAIEIINIGLRQFLNNCEEDKVAFPDLGTVSRYSPPDKFVYDDEEAIAKTLKEKKLIDLYKEKISIDKTAIKKWHKENKGFPCEGIKTESQKESVRVTRAKKK